MKVAVTVTRTEQISVDDYKDHYYTKVFEDTATIAEINAWCNTFGGATIFAANIAELKEETSPPK